MQLLLQKQYAGVEVSDISFFLSSRESSTPPPSDVTASEEVDNVPDVAEAVENLKIDVGVQANLLDSREDRGVDGTSFADILCDMNGNEKCTQWNTLPPWKNEDKIHVTLPELLSTKEKLFTFTGLHSLEMLDTLVECVAEIAVDSSTLKKMLPLRERVLLTAVKLKQNLSFTAIGVLFGINRQTCCNYFKNMCPLLSIVLKSVIPWPDQSLIRCNLPVSFKKFKDTRIVLDCCEVSVEKSKCLKCRILTYSQYKKDHTLKFNMGIAPCGLITELSPAFGGRASDKLIVHQSEILDKLSYRDGVMVDKGYKIDKECEEV